MRARKGATATRPAEPVARKHAASSGAPTARGRQPQVTQLVLQLPTAATMTSLRASQSDGPRTSRRAGKAVPPAIRPRPASADAPEAAPTTPAPRGEPPVPMSVRRQFVELRAALADGWEIVQPIYARPLWSSSDDRTTAFNFVLSGPHGTRLITVPEGRMVERFIRERQLTVNHVR
jgi:hypothetical protein